MRVLRFDLQWLVKAVAILLVVAPLTGWSQVMTSPSAFAGVDAAGNPTTVEAALRAMAAQAAVVFVGSVTQIRQIGGEGFAGPQGVVEVSFTVERGLRGAGDGETYVLREWGGLWSASSDRYKVGSRLLMLLHAPGTTGLSSPVGGAEGAIPVLGSSPLVTADALSAATSMPMADLRWLAARLSHPLTYRKPATLQAVGRAHALSGSSLNRSVGVVQPVAALAETEVAATPASTIPMAQASIVTVLQQMASWQNGGSDAR